MGRRAGRLTVEIGLLQDEDLGIMTQSRIQSPDVGQDGVTQPRCWEPFRRPVPRIRTASCLRMAGALGNAQRKLGPMRMCVYFPVVKGSWVHSDGGGSVCGLGLR